MEILEVLTRIDLRLYDLLGYEVISQTAITVLLFLIWRNTSNSK